MMMVNDGDDWNLCRRKVANMVMVNDDDDDDSKRFSKRMKMRKCMMG
jgi:hypothetical protein